MLTMADTDPTPGELSRRLHDFRQSLMSLAARVDELTKSDASLAVSIGTLLAEFTHLEEAIDEIEAEVKDLKRERVESRKWAVPVGISIITLLVLVISNTLTLVYR